jgi:hypothetical protein
MPSVLPTIDEKMRHEDETMKTSKRPRYNGILSTRTADACLDWVVFPALLFVQFGATMYCQSQQGMLTLNWIRVLATVAIFCIVAGIYRQVLRRHPMDSLLLLLLPEIFTNILLALVMFGNIESAFQVLVILTLVLMAGGALATVHSVILQRNIVPEDYRPLNDKEEEESEDEWIC